MSSLDYLDLCRLCLVKDRVSVPIFDGEGDVRQIFLKIAACLPVKVAREDKLPKKICDDCVYKVELFYQFWNTTANAEKQLLQWLGNVSLEEKQGYVSGVLDSEMMKQEQADNRLDVPVMQSTSEHSSNMAINMIDGMNLGIPIIMSTDQQISVPISSSNNTVQTVQSVPGPSTRSAHNQMTRKDGTNEAEEDTSEDDNTDEDCDADEGLPVKEENEDTASANRAIEPSTYVNVAMACDEAGPSGLQQQKLTEMPEIAMQQTSEADPKSGHGKKRLRLLKIHHDPVKSVNEEKYQRTISNNTCKKCGIKFPLESMLLRHTFNQVTVSRLKKLYHLKTMRKNRRLVRKITRVKYDRRCVNVRENESSFSLARNNTTNSNIQNNSMIYEVNDSREFKMFEESKMILRTRNHQKNYKVKLHEFPSPKSPIINTNSIIKANEAKTTEELHKCDLCDYMCSKKNTLYAHRRKHGRGIKREVFSCNECNFKSKKQSSLYSHIWKKHESIQVPAAYAEMYSCNACDYKNKSKYALKIHIARKHTDDYKYVCETCGRKYKVKGDLTNHIRFNHREQPVICDVCGKTCLNSNSLYVHQKFAHYKAQFECQVCKRRMVSQENLDEHMQRQHEKRDNVDCKECGKTFSRHSRLKVHMRIHTGDKPYTCTVCSKSFARRPALKQHLLTHTGVRPYVCVVCGKAFTQKPGLISHRKSHPGPHPPLPRVLIDHILNNVMNI